MKKLVPLLIFLILFPACKGLQYGKKPKVTIENSDIESITLTDMTMKFDIGIQNPYPIALSVSAINIDFMMENNQLLKTSAPKGLKIKASGKETTSFNVNIRYEDMIKIVKDYMEKDYLDCVVNVEVIIPMPDIPGLDKNFSYQYALKKKLPALKPSFDVADFKVELPPVTDLVKALTKSMNISLIDAAAYASGQKKFGLSDLMKADIPVTIKFDMLMSNKTKAGLNFNLFNYDFSVNSERLVKGSSDKISNSGKTSKMTVSNVINSKNLAGSFIKAHKAGKGNYAMKGEASLKLPEVIQKKPVKFIIDTTGGLTIK
jgi:LEA14-like dessication related protein